MCHFSAGWFSRVTLVFYRFAQRQDGSCLVSTNAFEKPTGGPTCELLKVLCRMTLSDAWSKRDDDQASYLLAWIMS